MREMYEQANEARQDFINRCGYKRDTAGNPTTRTDNYAPCNMDRAEQQYLDGLSGVNERDVDAEEAA